MSQQNFSLFAIRNDPAHARWIIEKLIPGAKFTDAGSVWTRVVMHEGLAHRRTLTITHDPGYYSEPNWSRQKLGMAGFFSQGEPSGRRQVVVESLIPKLTFCLGFIFEPPPDGEEHPWTSLMFTLAAELDGMVFVGDELLDPDGGTILGADGRFDEDAELPGGLYGVSPDADENPEDDDGEFESDPPSEEAVKKQTLALAALVGRGLIERDHRRMEDPPALHRRLLEWTKAVGAWEVLDENETRVLQIPPGELAHQQAVNLLWRVEGLELLIWALQMKDLPAWDEISDVDSVLNAVGFLGPDRTVEGELRAREGLDTIRGRIFAVHWRIRNWSLKPERMDFRKFAREAWFGPLDISDVFLVDDDLAVMGTRIDEAGDDALGTAASICEERHKAANWLAEGGNYAETDTST